MLMGPDHRRIDVVDRPVELAARIGLLLQRGQDAIPDPGFLPAIKAAGDGLPRAEAVGQVTPGSARFENPPDPVDDAPMVMVGAPHPRLLRWEK
jgi:hypothetical protein